MKNVVLVISVFVLVLMPVQLMTEPQYAVIAPDRLGPDFTIMLQGNFVIKNPFGSI